MRRRVAANERRSSSTRVEVALRHDLLCERILVRLDDLNAVHLIQIAVVNPQRTLRIPVFLVLAVLAPIGRHKINPPVAVKIPHGHSVPPARQFIQPPSRRLIHETTASVDQNLDRTPLASHN